MIHPNCIAPGLTRTSVTNRSGYSLRHSQEFQSARLDTRLAENWEWFAGCLFIHIPLDMLSTFVALTSGMGTEINPLIHWGLQEGLFTVAGIYLVAGVSTVPLFTGVIQSVRSCPPRIQWKYELLVETWLGGLLALGLGVFANNLLIALFDRALITLLPAVV